ncbi:hypothetical protein BIY24_14950 [Halobacteriovorax marinus]|uniref:PilZ domain-containing protein n=1 Tax=Halobacteriovorax marinus (strain ATCC BAA-682 / DSM 15412 / SJ) TaxID=862908 RepID=E1WZY0_HALMS|nr:hypothetical protein [Halobacteriovorax marinus]ATH09196.1 hypothetical protein BIY24_14950 [Halobacteriovorax marinus]CBW27916.1 hypothetical protein BMS_3159 [Halobacteriovorax marinus SJ]
MDNRQALRNIDEISQILEKISSHGNYLEFCQTVNGLTYRSQSLIKFINNFSYDIALRPKDKLNQFQFIPDIPIFAKNEMNSIVFKCEIKQLNHHNLIVANFPELLYLLNTREGQRLNFENLSLPLIFKNPSLDDYQRSKLFFGGNLSDFSRNGLSFITYNDNCLEYKIGDKIVFSTINGYSLKEPITGTLVYMQKVNNTQIVPSTKLAIRFDRAIPLKQILRYIDNQIYINV